MAATPLRSQGPGGAAGVIGAVDAAWFAVLVLYVIQVLYQKPGAYGALLAVGGVNGIGPCLTRRLGMWPVLLLAGLAMAASPVRPRAHRERFMAALMLAASSPPALCST
jgi:hypothetical protein